VLVGYHVVLVFRIDRLVVRGNKDVVVGQAVLAEILPQIGEARLVHVDERVTAVFALLVADGRDRRLLSEVCTYGRGGQENTDHAGMREVDGSDT